MPGCFPEERVRKALVRASLLLAMPLAMPLAGVAAQQPPAKKPLVGTVSPRAVGPAVQQPAPIGGLRTVPLGSRAPEPLRQHRGRRGFHGVVPLRVIDAPLVRGGAVVVYDGEPDPRLRWRATADRPSWHVDSLAPRVDAWRDIIVQDVICADTGLCLERSTRMRARWSAFCACYVFADGMNRVWRVE